jgi:hypothetical protein
MSVNGYDIVPNIGLYQCLKKHFPRDNSVNFSTVIELCTVIVSIIVHSLLSFVPCVIL